MSFSLTILGSNSALPSIKRFTSAHLLNANERIFLFDCGEGTQIRLRQHSAKLGRLNHIFISHLHGDHFFGLVGLLSTLSLLGRKTPIHIYADEKLEEIIKSTTSIYDNTLQFEILFHHLIENEVQTIIDERNYYVQSFPLRHRIPTWGFIFREKEKDRNILKNKIVKYKIPVKEIIKIKSGANYITSDGKVVPNSDLTLPPYKPRSYAYVSDTIFSEKYASLLSGIDLLYHEATFLHKDLKKARSTLHSTAQQAAGLAKKVKAGKLLLGHISERYKDGQEIEDEAKAVFPEAYQVEDGDKFTIKQTRIKN